MTVMTGNTTTTTTTTRQPARNAAHKPDGKPAGPPWPPQVELILSALEAGRREEDAKHSDRRTLRRVRYRARARLRLFSDGADAAPRLLYTRDAHARGLGFLTEHRLPLGYGGLVELPGPDGRPLSAHCTVLRCREAAPGWFEGSVSFNRDLPELNACP